METDDGKEQVSALMLTMFDALSKSKGTTNTYGDGGVIPKHQLGTIMRAISRVKGANQAKKVMKQLSSHLPTTNVTTRVPYRTLPNDVIALPHQGELHLGFSKSKYFPKTVRIISHEKAASDMLSNSLNRARSITEPTVSAGTVPPSILMTIGKKVGNGLLKIGGAGVAGVVGGAGLEWGRKKAANGEQYQPIDIESSEKQQSDSTSQDPWVHVYMDAAAENAPSKQPVDPYFYPKD